MNAFEHHKRGPMPPQRISRVFLYRKGRCGILQNDGTWGDGCGWKFGVKGDYEVDHILALENGGTDDDDVENFQLLCEVCHQEKTGDDHALAGHGRRMATKHTVPKRFRTGKGWRK